MHAVYELSTVKPHLPKRRRYTLAELAIYSDGYYQALAMALQVMQLAFRRWESRTMREQKPHLVDPHAAPGKPDDLDAAVADHRVRFWIRFLSVAAVVGILEVLALLAALIARTLP